jgi:hypothetical protein
MNVQKDFKTDWDRMCEVVGWLMDRMDGDDGVVQLTESVIGEHQDFITRWQDQALPAWEQDSVDMLKEALQPIVLRNQLNFTTDLYWVLHARLMCCCAKDDFETGVAELVANQAQKRETATSEPQCDSDATRFRELENAIEEAEATFKADWAELQCAWPGRVTAAIKERLGRPESDDLSVWYEELACEKLDLLEAIKNRAAKQP